MVSQIVSLDCDGCIKRSVCVSGWLEVSEVDGLVVGSGFKNGNICMGWRRVFN